MPVDALTAVDVVAPSLLADARFSVRADAGDIADPSLAESLIADRPDVIFHLAAIVSGEAELDFDKGYSINLDGTRYLYDAVRRAHLASERLQAFSPRLRLVGCCLWRTVSAGHRGRFQSHASDELRHAKAIGELLLADYSRKGFFDGVGIRFPTICVRPGKPNAAASFFSNIIREPLVGKEAILPVPDTVRHTHASPRAAVGFCLHAATLDTAKDGLAAQSCDARRLGVGRRADRRSAPRRGRKRRSR